MCYGYWVMLQYVFLIADCGQEKLESHSNNQAVELLDYMITHMVFSNKGIVQHRVFLNRHTKRMEARVANGT